MAALFHIERIGASLAEGAYPQAAWARSQQGLQPPTRDFSFACFGETRAPHL